jgi:hypothetical protein
VLLTQGVVVEVGLERFVGSKLNLACLSPEGRQQERDSRDALLPVDEFHYLRALLLCDHDGAGIVM